MTWPSWTKSDHERRVGLAVTVIAMGTSVLSMNAAYRTPTPGSPAGSTGAGAAGRPDVRPPPRSSSGPRDAPQGRRGGELEAVVPGLHQPVLSPAAHHADGRLDRGPREVGQV